MSQYDIILNHLKHHDEGITALEAMRDYGILRLAARIADLKADGYEIVSVTEKKGGKRWARYTLAKEA